MERRSTDWIEDRLARLLPEREQRLWLLERFREGVERAHATNPQGWVLSTRRERGALRLIVGRILVLGISQRGVFVAVDEAVRGTPASVLRLDAMFSSVPSVLGGWNPFDDVHALWSVLADPWLAAIDLAAARVQRTPYHKGWSEPLRRTVGAWLERELPRPSYAMEPPPPGPSQRGWKCRRLRGVRSRGSASI